MTNISLNNQNFIIGGDITDDQWTYNWLRYAPNVALAAKSGHLLDLVAQGYLPDDGLDYELLLSVWVWTTNKSGQTASIWIYGGENASSNNGIRVAIAGVTTRANSTQVAGQSCIFPLINNNKKLFIYNSSSHSTSTSWGVQLAGYRKINKY